MRFLLFLGVVIFFTLAGAESKKCHCKRCKGKPHHDPLAWEKITPSNTKFASDLYRRMALDHPSENIVFSPVSVSTAFALLSLGAGGKTRSQILDGLCFNSSKISDDKIHEGFHQLLDLLNAANRQMQLSNGNALFISKEHKVRSGFLKKAKKFYSAETIPTDFKKTEEAKNDINSYVEKNTKGKIAKLLDSVDKETVLVLINFIYFKDKWENEFNTKRTREGDFHVNGKKTVKVQFMNEIKRYNMVSTEDATVVSIPYKGDAEAIFILPKEGKLSEVEQSFNEGSIAKWKNSMKKQFVNLFLPRFSASGTINLIDELRKMGLIEIFSDHPDLSALSRETNLKITKAIHKAVLNVNEEGTEAAAATGIEIGVTSFPVNVSVTFDHPFMFALYDNKTKTVLFIGRIMVPEN